MPAVAWLLLSAALGLGVLTARAMDAGSRGRRAPVLAAVAAIACVAVLAWQQMPRLRGQAWFFGRASRNIRDQHIKTARLLRRAQPEPRRVLVGDAGAIPYVLDLPALDIIGLGGYGDLPFARAGRLGVAAAIELIERIPRSDRPDILAIYPSWWGDFPVWFGKRFGGVGVHGNVICGGHTKVLYRADWSPLEHSGVVPLSIPAEAVMDVVDFADLVNEKEHEYRTEGAAGHVTMKLLRDSDRGEPLWDAGRIVPPGARTLFTLSGLVPDRPLVLRFRLAPAQPAELVVTAAGMDVGLVTIAPAGGWTLAQITIAAHHVQPTLSIRVEARGNEVVLYHLWAVQQP